jgi:thiamine transporter
MYKEAFFMFLSIINLFISKTDDGEFSLTTLSYIILVVIMLLVIAANLIGSDKKEIKTKQVVFSAVAVALAVVTSFIKFGSLPFGGSITLFSMFFICFIGYLYGLKAGLITGIAYGILQLIIEPYIFHPAQVLLDYPLAFGCLGLSGLFSKARFGKYNLLFGYIIGVFGRYICHVISGYIFFGSYAPENMNSMVYTLGYNATYILPEAIATIVIISIVPVANAFKEVKKLANQTN